MVLNQKFQKIIFYLLILYNLQYFYVKVSSWLLIQDLLIYLITLLVIYSDFLYVLFFISLYFFNDVLTINRIFSFNLFIDNMFKLFLETLIIILLMDLLNLIIHMPLIFLPYIHLLKVFIIHLPLELLLL